MASFAGGMEVSFQAENHLSGVFGPAPNSDVIIVAAPQRKVACMTDLACACPVMDVQPMGAVGAAGLNWVAVLKRDPHAPGFPEGIGMPRPSGRGPSLILKGFIQE